MLTTRQLSALNFIIDYQREYGGVSPSYNDLRKGLGITGTGQLQMLLGALEDRGFIRRLPRQARAIEVLKNAPGSRIPIWGGKSKKILGYVS